MATLQKTWSKDWAIPSAYDFAVQRPKIAQVAALALWGLDFERLQMSIRKLALTPAGSSVLDVPCGGGLAFHALGRSHGLDYTALDYSPVMLERAARTASQLGLNGIRFRRGDVSKMAFADDSFDLCITYNGLHCFPDPEKATQEMARVLKTGGRLRGSMVVKKAGWRYDRMIGLFQCRGWFGPTATKQNMLAWMQAAGLEVVDSEQSGALWLFEACKRH